MKAISVGVLVALLTAAMGFSPPPAGAISFRYGKLERSREVTRAFETLQPPPELNYYWYGLGNIPYAIIGIEKSYRLRPGLWKPVELTLQILRGWIRQMDIVYDGFPPYGFQILNDRGEQIGIWYSSKQWTTVILEDGNQVAVIAPEPPGFNTR